MANFVAAISTRSFNGSLWRGARPFAFAIVSLGAFLVGLYCFATPPSGYIVRAVLGLRLQATGSTISSAASQEQQCQVRDEILSREQLGGALARIGPPPRAERDDAAEFPYAAEIDFVRERVGILPEKSEHANEARLALTFTGSESSWSVALVEEMAAQACAKLEERVLKTAANEVPEKEQVVLAESRQKEQTARRALDDFLSSHFDSLNRLGRPVTETKPSAEAASNRAALPVPRLNPKWQTLREQLTALVSERETILLNRTEEHPEAKEAAVKIEALKRQLDESPKFIVDEAAPPPAAQRKPGTNIGAVQFTAPDSPSGAGREYERLLAEVKRAREHREAAERIAAATEPESTGPATEGAAVVRGRIVSNAHVFQTLRKAPSIGRLTILALASIFVGACACALIRTSRALSVYATLTEIEKDLALPVAGVVAPSPPLTVALSR